MTATPEPAFAQPVTMKETKDANGTITRLYYQGGNVVLQQELNVSSGSVGQLVFYKHAEVVDDTVGTLPPHVFSSREIIPNDFKIKIQSIAADSVSPAKLRILDSSQEIITEFFIDKTGLMRPVTKAEHDSDIAAREAVFKPTPSVSHPGGPMTDDEAKSHGVAALVNLHPILEVTVEQQGADVEKQLKATYSGDKLNQKIVDARENVLKALIDRQLIIDDFKAAGGFIPESYTDARIDDIVTYQFGGDRNAFLKATAARGATLETYKREIEDVAIVGLRRNKFVSAKIAQYYRNHLDLFPQDEQVNVSLVQLRGFQPVPSGRAAFNDPQAELAHQILLQMKTGADVSAAAKKYPVDENFDGKPLWICKDGPASLSVAWPFTWAEIEKMKPGQTTDVVTINGEYSRSTGPSQTYPYYYILRLNERHPATIAATEKATQQKETLLNLEKEKVEASWIESLRTKGQIQIFAQQ